MSVGTSPPIIIPRESLRARDYAVFSKVQDKELVISPPEVSSRTLSTALTKYVNPYPEFTFEKVSGVEYGPSNCIARTTGFPSNRPDFIYDYYFIALMRCIDKIVKPEYSGRLDLEYDTPESSS